MSAFANALAALHADANFGVAASYTPADGEAVAVTVVWSAPTDVMAMGGMPGVRAGTKYADIIATQLGAVVPRRGDALQVGAAAYQVEDVDPDDLGLSWKLTLAPRPRSNRGFTIGDSAIGGPDPIG